MKSIIASTKARLEKSASKHPDFAAFKTAMKGVFPTKRVINQDGFLFINVTDIVNSEVGGRKRVVQTIKKAGYKELPNKGVNAFYFKKGNTEIEFTDSENLWIVCPKQ